jgi:hypothetical protein
MTFIAGFLPSFVKSRKSELERLFKVEIIDKRRAAPVTDRSPFSLSSSDSSTKNVMARRNHVNCGFRAPVTCASIVSSLIATPALSPGFITTHRIGLDRHHSWFQS